MLLIDELALVAGEELAKLREEEQRQKEMQQRALREEEHRQKEMQQKAERRKLVDSSDENGGDDGGGGHGNVKIVTVVTRESNLKLKVKMEKNCDNGSTKEEGKTETVSSSTPDLPTKLKNYKRNLLVGSSDENGDGHGHGGTGGGHGNVKAVTAVTRESNLKSKVKIRKNCDDGSTKEEEGKTETASSSAGDLPTKLKSNKRNLTELDNSTNPSPDTLTTSQNKKRKPEADNGPDPPADLPPEFKDMILEKAQGEPIEDAVLVIQKKLTQTDIQDHQNRFSIPLNQIKNRFLNEEDENFIKGRGANGKCNVLEVDIIEPKGKVRRVHLTRWVMTKLSGQSSISYVLNGEGWKKIKANNHLKVKDVVQLWAVQILGKTCLVFVKIEEKEEGTIIP